MVISKSRNKELNGMHSKSPTQMRNIKSLNLGEGARTEIETFPLSLSIKSIINGRNILTTGLAHLSIHYRAIYRVPFMLS